MKKFWPLLILMALVLTTSPVAAQSDAPTSVDVQPRIYPFALWGPQSGLGFGAGLSVRNLGWDGSHMLLTAKPAAHWGRYTLGFATHNPHTAPHYGLLDLRYEKNGRYWFHGVGPASSSENRISANVEAASVRLRLGYRPGNGPLVIQPTLGLSRHTFHGIKEGLEQGSPFWRLDYRSRSSISLARSVPGEPNRSNHRTGIVGGLQVAFDIRDRAHLPTRGVLLELTGKRYVGLDDLDLRFNRYKADAYTFLPLAPHHVLTARASLTVTRSRSVLGRQTSTLPFYLLPRLGAREVPGFDRHRYFDNDRLIFSLGYRFPLFRFRDLVIVSGELAGHAANVYEDVFEQAAYTLDDRESSLQARSSYRPPDEKYPLQEAGSVGLYVAPLFRDDLFFEAAVGLSADGVSVVQFKMVQSFRALRAPFL